LVDAVISAIASALAVIIDLADGHPDLAKSLAARVGDLLDGHDEATVQSLEARRAMKAGVAAACANAVQEASRRRAAAQAAVPAASAITRIRERLEQSTDPVERVALSFALGVVTGGQTDR
jgi:hypothetical protein